MTATYSAALVILSILIAIVAAYTAFALAGRVNAAKGWSHGLWLAGGATALGIGIWSMHFIGMLAYQLPVPMTYDVPIVLFSMLVAILASGVALTIASEAELGWKKLLLGSVIMGNGIAAMHYTGMEAMQIQAEPHYHIGLVVLSLFIAIGASYGSLCLAFRLRGEVINQFWQRLGSAIGMGGAIYGMHYTAMAAVRFEPIPGVTQFEESGDHLWLAIALGGSALVILVLAMTAAFMNRRLSLELARANALSESEARFRALVQNASDIIAVVAEDSRITYVSSSIQHILGCAPEAWVGKKVFELAHPDDVGKPVNLLMEVLQNEGTNFTSEFRLHHCDRSWREFEVIATNLLSEPAIGGIVITCRDITERKQAEELVRESESRFQIMADTAPVMIWMSGLDKLCDYFNKGWLEFTGRSLEQEMGNGWAEGVHPDDFDRCLHIYTTAFDARQSFNMEYRLRRFDGEYRWIFDMAVPRYTPSGKFVGMIGSCLDITLRKQAEEEREQLLESEKAARQMAEVANRLKDEFLANLSHELRTPLNAMLGWTQLLRTRTLDEATTNRGLETIDRNTRSLARLVEDVLDVSSIITGKLRMTVYPVELIPVLEASIDSVRSAADAKQIRLEYVFGSRTGPVLGDADRLQQVIWNLLSNAIKFTPSGGKVEIRLERIVSGQATGDQAGSGSRDQGSERNQRFDANQPSVEIRVTDTGKGISPEFLPCVFDRFSQADGSTTRTYGGLGLGLSIVRHLVELHGGVVWAESLGIGKGARFVIRLPLANMPLPDESSLLNPLEQDSQEMSDRSPILEDLRVLVVDDEADARALLEAILERDGATVKIVSSTQEALKVFSTFKPHVLVSDIGMPGENGYSLIQQLRSLPAHQGGQTPAIALSAYAREEDRLQAERAGFQLHMSKPVNAKELVAAVANLSGRMIAR
ncbi:MAG TPA: MHYT domain-containing protein [Trichocoleus sp.]